MKASHIKGLRSLLFVIATLFALPEKANAQAGTAVSYQTFYNELSPYGRWINTPQHGYVWLPDVEPGFQPYSTRGYWVMTEYGNTWVSDYSWGWAPFHYGRWYFDDYYGWAWVPGTEWGPAWVTWRSGRGYYGWAPLTPGLNIHVSVNIPVNYWVFVPQAYITSPRIYSYYVPRRRCVNIYQSTVVVNNYYTTNNYTYVSGPSKREVERITRRPVRVHNVQHIDNPGRASVRDGVVRVYKPSVNANTRTASRPTTVHANTNSRRSNSRVEQNNAVNYSTRQNLRDSSPSGARAEANKDSEAARNYGNSRSGRSSTFDSRATPNVERRANNPAPPAREATGNYGNSRNGRSTNYEARPSSTERREVNPTHGNVRGNTGSTYQRQERSQVQQRPGQRAQPSRAQAQPQQKQNSRQSPKVSQRAQQSNTSAPYRREGGRTRN